MPKGNPGKKHPPGCRHCAAINLKKSYFFSAGESTPRCKCHKEPMLWNKIERLRAGGTWRCSVTAKTQSRKSRLRKLGITEQDYQKMMKAQNNLCAICGGKPDTRWEKLAVDHCHSSGRVRGLLCMVCNTMLGRFEKNRDKVMEYLSK